FALPIQPMSPHRTPRAAEGNDSCAASINRQMKDPPRPQTSLLLRSCAVANLACFSQHRSSKFTSPQIADVFHARLSAHTPPSLHIPFCLLYFAFFILKFSFCNPLTMPPVPRASPILLVRQVRRAGSPGSPTKARPRNSRIPNSLSLVRQVRHAFSH